MAQRVIISMGMAFAMLAFFSTSHVSAQSGCMTTIVSLSPCLSYINGNSTIPSTSCCSTLSSVVKNEPQCLCVLLNGGTSTLGITVNATKALELPPACKVKTPSVSLCQTSPPAAAPTASKDTPSTATPSTETPSTATPSTETPSTASTTSIPNASTGSKNTESSSAESHKSAVISIVFLAASALASMI